MNIYDKLVKKETKLALIGLGYVGLPIALEFAKKIKVVGFDINQKRVDMMKNNIDPSDELVASDFQGCDIEFTADIEDLKECTFFIVAVPTPIDESKEPNIKPLLGASTTVGKALKKGDYVVYESTVYPGCTEDDCIPVLEEVSGLKWKEDFYKKEFPKHNLIKGKEELVGQSQVSAIDFIVKTNLKNYVRGGGVCSKAVKECTPIPKRNRIIRIEEILFTL